MIPALLMLCASAADLEENTFAVAYQLAEWATPDVRFEVSGEPVRTVLSWPIIPFSASFCRFSGCRAHLLLEPVFEPQVRLGDGRVRMLAGGQVLVSSAQPRLGWVAEGHAVLENGQPGWAVGTGPVFGAAGDSAVRHRFTLRARYVRVRDVRTVDLALGMAGPLALRGWGRIARREPIGPDLSFCQTDPAPPPDSPLDTEVTPAPGLQPPDPVWPPDRDWDRPRTCDPYGCGPDMCGVFDDGCGGTMNCGACPGESLDRCLPAPCSEDQCGPQPDGCGGTVSCTPCDR